MIHFRNLCWFGYHLKNGNYCTEIQVRMDFKKLIFINYVREKEIDLAEIIDLYMFCMFVIIKEKK